MTAPGAVALLARAALRRQWRALFVPLLLLAVGGAATLAALAGALRTNTAADRALEASEFADVSVDVSGIAESQVEPLRRAPGVKELSLFGFTAVRPTGTDLTPGIDVVGILPFDARALQEMDRPHIDRGRLPRPDRIDEAMVNRALARRLRIRVGDILPLESHRQSEVNALFESADPPEPTGARGHVRVVGIGADLTELVDPNSAEFGAIVLTPAWFQRFGHPFAKAEEYQGDAGIFRILMRARLTDGDRGVKPFLDRVYEAYQADATTIFAEARSEVFGSAETTLRVEALALLLCAIAAGVATAVAAGQALTRQQHLAAAPVVGVARAVGIPARDLVVAIVLPSFAVVTAALVLSAAGAVAASGFFPRGLARELEPSPGLDIDGPTIVVGGALLGIVVMLMCVVGGARASREIEPTTALVPRMRLPLGRPEIGVGVRMALHAGRGATRVPTRQTVVGAIVGVAGVMAALTFAASLDRLVDTPRLYGSDYDARIALQTATREDVVAHEERLTMDPRISGVTRTGLAELSAGDQRLPAEFFERLKGVAGVSVLSGRLPVSPDEVALTPDVIPGAGPRVGSVVKLSGGGDPVDIRVVGHLTGRRSAVLTHDAGQQLGIEQYDDPGYLLRFAGGVDAEAARLELGRDYAEVYPVEPPDEMKNVERVRGFPYALAVLLASLAVAAVAHLLATAIRRRVRDLAVLKALGFSRRSVRGTVRWQALTVAAIAVLAGGLLGTIAGRGAWALVTSNLRVVFAPAVPPLTMLAVAAGAIVVTLLVASVPARVAARTPPAVALRTE